MWNYNKKLCDRQNKTSCSNYNIKCNQCSRNPLLYIKDYYSKEVK